jgi:glutamyl-Q tRNA(Asp) synthetase
MISPCTTRFAPSPTGLLHLGHAYSALFAFEKAQHSNGEFILRIEDIDPGRCRDEFETQIYEDLSWLGLTWQEPVRRQSEHLEDYKNAISRLLEMELLYPCFCTRKDIQNEINNSGHAPHGPEGYLYPGTCRDIPAEKAGALIDSGQPFAYRLEHDEAKGKQKAAPEILGDVVLARKDIMSSYHLSVTIDDHIQKITHVSRGEDLFYATHLHRLLQELLGLDVPLWHHHKLLLDENGKRFAKRNHAVTLRHLREEENKSPGQIREMAGFGAAEIF